MEAKDAFYSSDALYLEVESTNTFNSALMDCYTYPSTKTIKDVIPKDLFEKIKVHFENLGIDIELWLDKRPQFVDAALFHASTELLFPFDGFLCDGIQCSDVLDFSNISNGLL